MMPKKCLSLLLAVLLSLSLCSGLCTFVSAKEQKGDTDGDGILSIRDVTVLLLYLADPQAAGQTDALDVNGDSTVSIADVTVLLALIADPPRPDEDLEYDSEIDLSALADGQVVTLSTGGTYLVTGSAANAQIVINNKNDDFNLLLYNASITYLGEGAAIQADKCKNCTLTMVTGSVNRIADSANNTEDAALQVKGGDLKLKGSGYLQIESKTAGIYNTKDLKIDGPTVSVTSKSHGIVVKKTITVVSGSVTVNAKGDGLKAKGDTDSDGVSHKVGTGVVTVEGGTVNITATKDGFDCEEGVVLQGGTVNVNAKGDGVKAVDLISIGDCVLTVYASEDGIKTTRGNLEITGGDLYVECDGDGINAEADLTVSGEPIIDVTTGGGHTALAGEVSCSGFKALGTIRITGGDITVDSAMYAFYAQSGYSCTVTPKASAGSGYSVVYLPEIVE